MELIRLLHPREYDRHVNLFRSSCFTNSSDKTGISLIDLACVRTRRMPVCLHIERYYPGVVEEPIPYWRIPADLPSDVQVEEKVSDTGDPCHRQIVGLSNNRSTKFFKRLCRPEDIRVCRNGQPIPCDQKSLETIFR